MTEKDKNSGITRETVAEGLIPEAVANYCIERAKKEKIKLTHLKLQKLVYILYSQHLVRCGKRLINEQPEAWEYGPVFRSLYHALKFHGSGNIESLITVPSGNSFVVPVIDEKYSETMKCLDETWEQYKDMEAPQLVAATHEEGTPWHKNYDRRKLSVVISDDDIRDYYRSR